jgi:hypothetical protein
LVKKGVEDGINGVEAMFTGSGDIGAQCTEDVVPVFCARAAGDFLLDFGLVDISLEPDQCRSEVQESHESACEFVIASENASIPLDSVDETFDDVAFSVADSVIGAWLLTIAAERNHHLDLLGCEQLSQRVGIVAFIGNNGVKMERGEQRFSLGHIMAFTPSQDELEGKAKGIDEEMDLAAESTRAPT